MNPSNYSTVGTVSIKDGTPIVFSIIHPQDHVFEDYLMVPEIVDDIVLLERESRT